MILKNIQLLRALAANGVVLAHLYVVEQKYGQGMIVLPASAQMGAMGVDLFFVISGFIMALLVRGATWRKFLVDRVTRIVPAYWFYTTLVLILSLLYPSFVNSSVEGQPSILRSYFLLPDSTGPLLAVGWTLIHEMYFYLACAMILFALTRWCGSFGPWLLGWGLVVVGLNLFFFQIANKAKRLFWP